MFSNMLVSEKKLLECCKKGKTLDFGKEKPLEKNKNNEIRGEFLRALILSNNQVIKENNKEYILKLDPRGIKFYNKYITGVFDFSFCNTDLPFIFKNSVFENKINLSDSKIRFLSLSGTKIQSLEIFRTIITSDVFFNNGFETNGEINFSSSEILGSLSCQNGKLNNENGIALNCDKIKIKGSVFLNNNFEAKGKVFFNSAQIESALYCSTGKFINEKDGALICNRIKIKGSVFLNDNFEAKGKVSFSSGYIGGSLVCTKGVFKSENGIALVFDKAEIKGSVFLNKIKMNGNANFNMVKIGGSLNCIKSKFENEKGDALNFNGSYIVGNVLLKNGFQAKGEVDFYSSQIGNNFECSSGRFINEKESNSALNCERMKIKGNVNLNDNFYAKGEVNFDSAQIYGNLNCDSGNIINENGYSLYCQNIKILGDVFLREKFYVKGDVDFYSAQIGRTFALNDFWIIGDLILLSSKIDELDINIENLEKINNFELDGLEYNHIKTKTLNFKWLEKMSEFKPQPYKQLAKVLKIMGHNKESNDIMIEYNDKIYYNDKYSYFKYFTQAFDNKKLNKYNFIKALINFLPNILGFIIMKIFKKTAGYGYKSMRVLVTMVSVWFICSLFYWNASKVAVFAPTNPLVFQKKDFYNCNVNTKGTLLSDIFSWDKYNSNNNWVLNENLDGEFTTFNPFIYSLDVILPIVDLEVEKDWGQYIAMNDWTLNDFTRWIMWFEILVGWIYSLILVAILSGLAKNEKD